MSKKRKHSSGIDVEATGKRIIELIKESGFNVKQVSVYMGVSPQAIYKWRDGKALPDVENLYILSKLLGCKIDDFIVTENKNRKNIVFGGYHRLYTYCIYIEDLVLFKTKEKYL